MTEQLSRVASERTEYQVRVQAPAKTGKALAARQGRRWRGGGRPRESSAAGVPRSAATSAGRSAAPAHCGRVLLPERAHAETYCHPAARPLRHTQTKYGIQVVPQEMARKMQAQQQLERERGGEGDGADEGARAAGPSVLA